MEDKNYNDYIIIDDIYNKQQINNSDINKYLEQIKQLDNDKEKYLEQIKQLEIGNIYNLQQLANDKEKYIGQIKQLDIKNDNYLEKIKQLELDNIYNLQQFDIEKENYLEKIKQLELNNINNVQQLNIEKVNRENYIQKIKQLELEISNKEKINKYNIDINNCDNKLAQKMSEIKNINTIYNAKSNELKIIKESINRYNIELIKKTDEIKEIDTKNIPSSEYNNIKSQISTRNIYTLQGINFVFIDNEIGLNIITHQLFDLKIFKFIELLPESNNITNASELIRSIIYKISYSQYMYTQKPYNAVKKCITHLCSDGGLNGIITNDYKLWTITNFDKYYIDTLINIIQRSNKIPVHELTSCFSLIYDCLGYNKLYHANLLNKSYDIRLSNPQYKFDDDIIYWFIQNNVN
jgi:hypothetical protein